MFTELIENSVCFGNNTGIYYSVLRASKFHQMKCVAISVTGHHIVFVCIIFRGWTPKVKLRKQDQTFNSKCVQFTPGFKCIGFMGPQVGKSQVLRWAQDSMATAGIPFPPQIKRLVGVSPAGLYQDRKSRLAKLVPCLNHSYAPCICLFNGTYRLANPVWYGQSTL